VSSKRKEEKSVAKSSHSEEKGKKNGKFVEKRKVGEEKKVEDQSGEIKKKGSTSKKLKIVRTISSEKNQRIDN